MGIAAVFFYTIGIVPILALVLSSIGLYKVKACHGRGNVQAEIALTLAIIYTVMYLLAYGHIPTMRTQPSRQTPVKINTRQRPTFPVNPPPSPAPTTTDIGESSVRPRNPALSNEIIRAAYEGRYFAVKGLLRDGADPNARGNEEATVLMAACINGNLDIVRLLVEEGADVRAQDREGWTPLAYARSRGHRQIEDFLKDHGATT